jgi:hypothetical protein
MERITKYSVEMGSGAMIFIANFIKIGSGIQTLLGGGVHREQCDLISLLLFLADSPYLLTYLRS